MTAPAFLDWFGDNNNGRYLFEGFLANFEIAVIAIVLSFALGLVLALLRLSRNRGVSFLTGAWVDVFRNLPLILLILFVALYLPSSWKEAWEDHVPGWAPDAFESGLILGAFIGLIAYNSAVLAEIMRAGILSLQRGQSEAASALGMTYTQSLRFVILPQGLRRMVPALVGQLITLNKDTTLVSIIGIEEAVRRGRIVDNNAGNPFTGSEVEAPFLEIFIVIGIWFVIVNYALSRLSRRLEIRERKRTGTTLERVKGLEDQVAADPV
jgi:His/Glu/Gln/Arg/opine family amino acid ABC transporter permease subunit